MATYNYTGGVQSYTIPTSGLYRLEVYGAGGDSFASFRNQYAYAGNGGYAKGYKYLEKGTVLYICCGGQNSAYNGGVGRADWGNPDASSCWCSASGGATHIAMTTNRGVLKNYNSYRDEVLIVAGGGGAGSKWYKSGDGYYADDGGAGGSGGGGSFGQGTASYHGDSTYPEGGGGGGWAGGKRNGGRTGGNGGTSYTGNVPAVEVKGTTYSPSTTNGTRNGNGYALINLQVEAFSITVSSNDEDLGTVSGGGVAYIETEATVEAIANTGARFDGWYIDGEKVSSSALYTFTATADVDIQAMFIKTFDVTNNSNNNYYGSVSGNGTYDINSSVTVTANRANSGFFLGWYNGDILLTRNISYTFNITNDVSYIAKYCSIKQIRHKLIS